jgi:hypothetical protein
MEVYRQGMEGGDTESPCRNLGSACMHASGKVEEGEGYFSQQEEYGAEKFGFKAGTMAGR